MMLMEADQLCVKDEPIKAPILTGNNSFNWYTINDDDTKQDFDINPLIDDIHYFPAKFTLGIVF